MRIHLYSLHGLFRAHDLEIGRDADNGGQIIYVMELAKALSARPEVDFVHLFTRRIDDPRLDDSYNQEVEVVNEKLDIRRIACGGKRYLPKEKLWPHLDEFIANAITHIKRENIFPQWLHGHYADAGYVASELSSFLNVPFAQTGHSLGRPKLDKLLKSGMAYDEAMKRFQFERRFAAEDNTLLTAEFVVTSTRQEIGTYDVYGHHEQAEFHVIPPGINFERYYPYYQDRLDGTDVISREKMQAKFAVKEHLEKFLSHPDKPIILTICRPDKKKNIEGLIHAYGTDKELQALANLVIFAGIRSDIETMPEGEKEVLTGILLAMDKYDLYGRLAIPKQHDTDLEVPEIYRLCGHKKGVFVNIALTEPFGLTILEATACGCPVVATADGGPAEILPNNRNGILVPPTDTAAIQQALREILVDDTRWKELSNTGVRNIHEHYSWEAHVKRYLTFVDENLKSSEGHGRRNFANNPKLYGRLKHAEQMLIADVDGTLVSETEDYRGLEELKAFLEQRGDGLVFGVATGRSLQSVRELFEKFSLPIPDVAICSVGTRIVYSLNETFTDKAWMEHIAYRWDPNAIRSILADFKGLEQQEEIYQGTHKISYYIEESMQQEGFQVEWVRDALGRHARHVSIIVTRGAYVDILPKRASKGRAVRFIGNKWNIPLPQTVVFGDAGNDLDMFTGATRGVVVGNFSPEMEHLRGMKRVYFSEEPSAAGILDGLRHFEIIPSAEGESHA